MKTTITQWLYMELDDHMLPNGEYDFNAAQSWKPVVWRFKASDDSTRVFIRAIQIEVDIPDDFDPTARQIAALEEKKRKAADAYHGMVAEINQQISKLQALTFEGAAS